MRYGINVLTTWNKDTPQFLLKLASEADKAGWDGFFLWDHLAFPWPSEVAEPWTILSAAATITENIKLGTIVTPLPRHRPQAIARQLATLDQVSHGRIILGAGLGNPYDYEPYGEESSVRIRAKKLDECLDILSKAWTGEPVNYEGKYYDFQGLSYLPTPIQKPRIPIWIGGVSQGAIKRASRWDGWCPVGPSESAGDSGTSMSSLKESIKLIENYRGTLENYDVVYTVDLPEDSVAQQEFSEECSRNGVTWILDHHYGLRMTAEDSMKKVQKGPPE